MAFKLGMGHYVARDSRIHSLDPRTKLLGALVVMISVFFIQNAAQLALAFICIVAISLLAHIPLAELWRSMRGLVVMLGLLAVFNLLLVRGGEPLLSWGIVYITTGGLRAALLYSTRMIPAIAAVALLLATTTQTELADALDSILAPLARVGVPAHELAMVFSLMLRFIPTIADEATSLLDAQAIRGAALTHGSLARRIRAVVPLVVALLQSALRHADGISRALDARCYVAGNARSHWHPMVFRSSDAVAAGVVGIYLVALVCSGWLLLARKAT